MLARPGTPGNRAAEIRRAAEFEESEARKSVFAGAEMPFPRE